MAIARIKIENASAKFIIAIDNIEKAKTKNIIAKAKSINATANFIIATSNIDS